MRAGLQPAALGRQAAGLDAQQETEPPSRPAKEKSRPVKGLRRQKKPCPPEHGSTSAFAPSQKMNLFTSSEGGVENSPGWSAAQSWEAAQRDHAPRRDAAKCSISSPVHQERTGPQTSFSSGVVSRRICCCSSINFRLITLQHFCFYCRPPYPILLSEVEVPASWILFLRKGWDANETPGHTISENALMAGN